MQGLIYAALIGSQRAYTLEHKHDLPVIIVPNPIHRLKRRERRYCVRRYYVHWLSSLEGLILRNLNEPLVDRLCCGSTRRRSPRE